MKPKARFLALGVAILLAAITGVTARVSVDYDHNVDFSNFKTYAFKFFHEQITLEKKAPVIHKDILAAITRHLETRGLEQVDEDPDFYVTYHVAPAQGSPIDTAGIGYEPGPGWRPGWGWDVTEWGDSGTTVSTYKEGSLIIDAFSAKTKNGIWRGAGHGALPQEQDEASKMIIGWVDKMFEKWAHKRKDYLKAMGKKD